MSQDRQDKPEAPVGVGQTALIVAQARAVESRRPDRLFDDPFAEAFVAAATADGAAPKEEIVMPNAAGVPTVVDVAALRGDSFAIRTRFFDDYLLDACQAGCRQVVLLAAGLDARAFRLAWPDGVRLFELDLSAVLAFKDGVLAGRSAQPTCRRVVVGADLRDDWRSALVAARFLAGEPTAWLAEGILAYLSEEERDRLIDLIGDLSAPGSRLALEHGGAPGPASAAARSFREAAGQTVYAHLKASEKPALSAIDPEGWLSRHGWRARRHDAAEVFAHCGRPLPPLLAAGAIRMSFVSADRQPDRGLH